MWGGRGLFGEGKVRAGGGGPHGEVGVHAGRAAGVRARRAAGPGPGRAVTLEETFKDQTAVAQALRAAKGCMLAKLHRFEFGLGLGAGLVSNGGQDPGSPAAQTPSPFWCPRGREEGVVGTPLLGLNFVLPKESRPLGPLTVTLLGMKCLQR